VFASGKKVKEVPGEQRMVDVPGLKPSAVYEFTVRARDAAGNLSDPSDGQTVTMLSAAAEDHQAPTRPTKVRGRAEGPQAVTLTWRGSTDKHGVASYEIYQNDSKIHSVAGGETTALVTGLRPGTDYTFTVRARDKADNVSPASGSVDVGTPAGKGDGASTAPAALAVKSRPAEGAYYLDMSWEPPKTGGTAMEYEIYLNGKFSSTLVWGAKAPKGRTSYSLFVDAKPGTVYRVKVRAKLPDGNWGGFSAQRTVTTSGGRT
jgi:chitodextrinase